MKILTASIVTGPLLLFGALPATAGHPVLTLEHGGLVRLVAAGDATSDRDSYTRRAKDEMREWQRKVHDFGEKAEAKGKEASANAKDDLNKAWDKTEAASRSLQAASTEGWEGAKASYEKAAHELAEKWHKIHPEDE